MAPSLSLLDGIGAGASQAKKSALAGMGVPDALLAGSSGSVARMQANAVIAADGAAPLPHANASSSAATAAADAAQGGAVKMFASIPADDAEIKAAPVPYRGSALYVLFTDLLLFIWQAPYIPTALVPLNLNRGAYPFQDMTLQGVVFQILALACSLLVLPVLFSALFVGIPAPVPTLVATWAGASLFLFAQGPEVVFGRNLAPDGHADEAWFFINGVATTPSGTRKALARFKELFGRNVVGINNRSLGPLADLAQCLIQRDLRWPTRDASAGYEVLKAALNDVAMGSKKKVVLIAHSQGGIIASAWVDQLLADFSREVLGALEVYTFASAASHFSSPLDSAGRPPFAHVEHFAHTLDYVCRIGVLAFTSPAGASLPVSGKTDSHTGDGPGGTAVLLPNADYPMPITSTFYGLLFVQPAAGHLICTHYLGDKSILNSRQARSHSRLARYMIEHGAALRRKT